MITSPTNSRVKHVHALLTQAKARRESNQVALEGVRLAADALRAGFTPNEVLHTPDADPGLLADLTAAGGALYPVGEAVLRGVATTESPQGVIAVFPRPLLPMPAQPARALILDALQDPGNLGTLLRTAAAAGADAVYLAPGCVDPFNPKALRAGMGAHFRVPTRETTWPALAEALADTPIYLATGDGDTVYTQPGLWAARWALVIGSEAHGAGEQAHALATRRLVIPMHRDTESLNAAAAAAVLLFEAARQRAHA